MLRSNFSSSNKRLTRPSNSEQKASVCTGKWTGSSPACRKEEQKFADFPRKMGALVEESCGEQNGRRTGLLTKRFIERA